ncbi:MAG: hypothetical protein HY580_07710 [Nitrospinae bacterium]|nr:hypothetical protein [Nitrospinota bacterium]
MISKNNIDTGCACLALLARFHHVAADPGALRHELGKNGGPFSDTDILRAASCLKLKSVSKNCSCLIHQAPHKPNKLGNHTFSAPVGLKRKVHF